MAKEDETVKDMKDDEQEVKEEGKDEGKEEGKEDASKDASKEQLSKIFQRQRVCEDSRRQADRPHPFWDTQPVPAMSSANFQESGPIDEAVKTVEDVRQEPYQLPDAFDWRECDVGDSAEVQEIYSLLSDHYVEDDDNMFRFDYSIPFLRWALTPPGYLKFWHLGVVVKSTNKLVGFISAIPAKIRVHEKNVPMVEINFLCVHKKLRSKRLAPVLIKEITRRANVKDIWQAVYTAGVVLPRPVSECRYYHRSLNPKKLIEVGFSGLGPRMTIARTVKLYKLPDQPQLEGIREMKEKDLPGVYSLLTNYLKKFALHPEFDMDEVGHWMLPRDGVIYSFVRENKSGVVTDVCSFYCLPSSILGNDKHNLLKAAYSYWNVATTVPLQELMNDALIFAKQRDFDVFNALDVMENEQFLKDLKFGVGDGYLQYYLYNWKCPKIESSGIGLVLL